MKIVRTTKSGHVDVDIPYTFTCNYCGKQNNKVKKETVFGTFVKSGRYDMNDAHDAFQRGLENNLDRNVKEEIRLLKLAVDLYAAKVKIKEKETAIPIDGVHGYHPDGGLFLDGRCDACGRCQVWDTEAMLREMPPMPAEEEPKWKSVANIVSVLVALPIPFLILIIGACTSLLPIKSVLIISGICFVVGMIAHTIFSPNDQNIAREKYEKAYLKQRNESEPNLPENLPHIDIDTDIESQ